MVQVNLKAMDLKTTELKIKSYKFDGQSTSLKFENSP